MTNYSPTELADGLVRLDFGATAATLRRWAQRDRLLPPLERSTRGQGAGSGARYEWTDPTVVSRAITLFALKAWSASLDDRRLFAWLAGFVDDTAELQVLWARSEDDQWKAPLYEAAQIATKDDARAAMPLVVKGVESHRAAKKMPPGFISEAVGLSFSPDYAVTAEGVRRLRDGYAAQAETEAHAALMKAVSPERVLSAVAFFRRYLARVSVGDVIRNTPPKALATAHDDLRVITALYRHVLTDAFERGYVGSATEAHFIPQLGLRFGRFFLLLDLGLRHAGYGDQVDASMVQLRQLNDPDLRMTFDHVFRSGSGALKSIEGLSREDVRWRIERYIDDPEIRMFFEQVGEVARAVWSTWSPLIDLSWTEVFHPPMGA